MFAFSIRASRRLRELGESSSARLVALAGWARASYVELLVDLAKTKLAWLISIRDDLAKPLSRDTRSMRGVVALGAEADQVLVRIVSTGSTASNVVGMGTTAPSTVLAGIAITRSLKCLLVSDSDRLHMKFLVFLRFTTRFPCLSISYLLLFQAIC